MPEPFVRVAGHRIDLSHLDRALFPRDGIVKEEIITYYRTIARVMLRHVRDRPLVLERFPETVDKDGILVSDRPDDFPAWVPGTGKNGNGGGSPILARSAAELVYFANQGTVTFHMGLSRIDRRGHPDRMVFDLDPVTDGFTYVPQAAKRLRRLLDRLGLPAFVQTTGGRGAHVVVPLKRTAPFEDVRDIADRIAARLAADHPNLISASASSNKTTARVHIDCSRNAADRTVVVPYSLRARHGAPVATPLDWKEMGTAEMHPDKYRIDNVLRRLAQKPDPWENMNRHASSPFKAADRLAKL